MASRNFSRKQSLEKEVKELYVKADIGAAGAVVMRPSMGVKSVTLDAAGQYTVTLEDKYTELMSVSVMVESAAAQDIVVQMISHDVKSAKTIKLRTLKAAVETAPTDGSVLIIKIDVKNTSAK